MITRKMSILDSFAIIFILSLRFLDTKSQGSHFSAVYDTCELDDTICKFGEEEKIWLENPNSPIPIISTNPLKLFDPSRDTLEKHGELGFGCVGEGNTLIFGEVVQTYEENYLSNTMLSLIQHSSHLNLNCRCGRIFEYVCSSFDVTKLSCSELHHPDISRSAIPVFSFGRVIGHLNLLTINAKLMKKNVGEYFVYSIKESLSPKHVQWNPSNSGINKKFKDLYFYQDEFSEEFESAYRKQRTSLQSQGMTDNMEYYLKIDRFIPGFLIPSHALELGYVTTRTYFNTAPQWKSIYESNWKIAQDFLQKLNYNTAMVVLHGSTLNKQGKLMNLYTDTRKAIHIPWCFAILVHDGKQYGSALVVLNAPYYNLKYVNENYKLACSGYSVFMAASPNWDYTRSNNGHFIKGFSFYCKAKNFVETTEMEIFDEKFKAYDEHFPEIVWRQWLRE